MYINTYRHSFVKPWYCWVSSHSYHRTGICQWWRSKLQKYTVFITKVYSFYQARWPYAIMLCRVVVADQVKYFQWKCLEGLIKWHYHQKMDICKNDREEINFLLLTADNIVHYFLCCFVWINRLQCVQ